METVDRGFPPVRHFASRSHPEQRFWASPQCPTDLLKRVVDGKIAKFWVPERFAIMVEQLSKTSKGKLDKRSLREKYSDLACLVSRFIWKVCNS